MAIDPGTISLVGKGIGALTSFLGGNAAAKKEREAYEQYIKALQEQRILNPEDYVADYEMIDPELLEYYNPELESAIDLQGTELENIQLDPQLRDAKMEALNRMSRMAEEGLTIEDEAAINEIQRDLGETNRGQQEAITQNMARRGQLGSGAELAARMAGQQAGYDQAAQSGEALATERSRRALQAALESGNLANAYESQDYSREAQLAQARDAIAEFNARNQQSVQSRNVGSKNEASRGEADLRNTAYTSNIDTKNTQADQRVSGLQGQTNQLNTRDLGVAEARKDQLMGAAANQRNQFGQIAKGISGASDYLGGMIKPSLNTQSIQGGQQAINSAKDLPVTESKLAISKYLRG